MVFRTVTRPTVVASLEIRVHGYSTISQFNDYSTVLRFGYPTTPSRNVILLLTFVQGFGLPGSLRRLQGHLRRFQAGHALQSCDSDIEGKFP